MDVGLLDFLSHGMAYLVSQDWRAHPIFPSLPIMCCPHYPRILEFCSKHGEVIDARSGFAAPLLHEKE